MIKAVIFDFDDTLVNTFETKALALQKTARDFYNFELTIEVIRQHWGKPYHEMMRILFANVSSDVDGIVRNFETIRQHFPAQLFDHVEETIEQLQKRVKLGIVTSTSRTLVLNDLTLISVSPDTFFYIQTFEDTAVHKPDPRVFVPILEKLQAKNIAKHEVIYVGDALTDFQAANAAGLQFYGVANAVTSKEVFTKEGAQVLVTMTDLLTLVDN